MLIAVDDDPPVTRLISRLVAPRTMRVAGSVSEAQSLFASSTDWAGALLDVGLPEGPMKGIDLGWWIRQRNPELPMTFLTGAFDRSIVEAAGDLRAGVLLKPPRPRQLAEFLRRCDEFSARTATIGDAARRLGLAPREVELVEWVAAANEASDFAAHAGIQPKTLKSYRETIKRKTGLSVEQLAIRLLAEQARAGKSGVGVSHTSG